MAIVIGLIYVWAFYGLLFAFDGFHLGQPLLWAILGVVFSLGLARLAQRHSPKQIAWGMIGLNPGWGLLVFIALQVYSQPDASGEDHAFFSGIALASVTLGVFAVLFSLGLAKFGGSYPLWGGNREAQTPEPSVMAPQPQPGARSQSSVILKVFRFLILPDEPGRFHWSGGRLYWSGGKEWRMSRATQITIGAVLSGFWVGGFSFIYSRLPFLPHPDLYESYALLGLSCVGLIWALNYRETLLRAGG